MTALKNELIGSWKLLSYIEVPVGGGDSLFPLGNTPKGILIFSPDGFMSVQISRSNHTNYKMEDRIFAPEPEIINRYQSYIAFSGTYAVDNTMSTVVYNIETSLFPVWEGNKQIRKIDFEGDILFQKTLMPIQSGGQLIHAYLTWKRADKVDISTGVKYTEDSYMASQ